MPNDRAIQFYYAFATKDDKWYTHYQNYKVVSAWEKRGGEILKKAKEIGISEDGLYKTEKGTFNGMQIIKMMANKYDVLVPIINKRGYEIRPSDVTEYMKTNTYKEESDVYRANLSLNLTFHYEWFVYLRETEKSVGFKIPILPQNYHEIFSLRGIPEGAQRRKALVHFVREHSRIIKRENVDTKTLVHKYLRGETKFNWRGLQVDVIPSKSDIINTQTKKKFCDK